MKRTNKGKFKKLKKLKSNGFQGYPIATVALYGPDNKTASKIAVGIVQSDDDDDVDILERWYSEEIDIRANDDVLQEILEFIKTHAAKSVVITEELIGCPHEEGKDYPEGEYCPHCPYWQNRDRWTGETIH